MWTTCIPVDPWIVQNNVKNVSKADSRTASVAAGLGSMLDSTTRTSDLESIDPSPFGATTFFHEGS